MKYRHGDIALHAVEKGEGEIIKHSGSFVVAEGETTGHKHLIKVANPADLIIRKDAFGNMYFQLLKEGTLSHEEHKTIKIAPGIYKEVREREKDWFSLSVRRVVD
jgi:hypothetical protein